MTALASLQAFAEYRGVGFDPTDVKALRTLEIVSTVLRMRTGQHIDTVQDDVQELRGTWEDQLWLPQIPVQEVSAVAVRIRSDLEFIDLIADSFNWSRDGALGRYGWSGPSSRVTVTYTHGYEPGHERLDDVENIVCAIAARVLSNPVQVQSQQIGTYQVTYADVAAAGLTEIEADLLRRLENPHA